MSPTEASIHPIPGATVDDRMLRNVMRFSLGRASTPLRRVAFTRLTSGTPAYLGLQPRTLGAMFLRRCPTGLAGSPLIGVLSAAAAAEAESGSGQQ
jgi:hypothetical protein